MVSTRTVYDTIRQHPQAVVFLLVLPAINLLFFVAILLDMGLGSPDRITVVALRLWLVFGLSFVVLNLLRVTLPALLQPDRYWRQLVIHIVVIVTIALTVGPLFELPKAEVLQRSYLMLPRIFLIMEITVYVTFMWMLHQQELRFAMADQLKEAQLNVLKSQSNPHFLFNTLNMITADISTNPNRARESVFDLADLLRDSIRLSENQLVSVADEIQLVTLYLRLQQRRFHDRLTFSIDATPETMQILIPSLLLQPVIENTIKWAVAPYAKPATIRVSATESANRLHITVVDSGPGIQEHELTEGNGFRILRRTLDLWYSGDYKLSLQSTSNGGVFSLDLPIKPTKNRHG